MFTHLSSISIHLYSYFFSNIKQISVDHRPVLFVELIATGGFLQSQLFYISIQQTLFMSRRENSEAEFDVFRLYSKKQESLSFIRVPASVLLFSSQYGIHLDDQFQDTAEFHLLMSFFPCKDALPGGVLAVFDKDVEGGTDAVLFHQLLIFHTFFM